VIIEALMNFALKGHQLLPFQGVPSKFLFAAGRCPTFLLMPFQGEKS
jgi:hypothetical protein